MYIALNGVFRHQLPPTCSCWDRRGRRGAVSRTQADIAESHGVPSRRRARGQCCGLPPSAPQQRVEYHPRRARALVSKLNIFFKPLRRAGVPPQGFTATSTLAQIHHASLAHRPRLLRPQSPISIVQGLVSRTKAMTPVYRAGHTSFNRTYCIRILRAPNFHFYNRSQLVTSHHHR